MPDPVKPIVTPPPLPTPAPPPTATPAQIAEFVAEKNRHMEAEASFKAKQAELERTLAETKKLNETLSSQVKELNDHPDAYIAKLIMEKNLSMEGIAKNVVNDPQTILAQEIKALRAENADMRKMFEEKISATAQSTDSYKYEQKLAQVLNAEKYKPIIQGADIMETIHGIRPNTEVWTRMAFDAMRQQQRQIPPEELADIILGDATGVIERFGKKFAPIPTTPPAPALGPDGKPITTPPPVAPPTPGAPPPAVITNATETALQMPKDRSAMTSDEIVAEFVAEQKSKQANGPKSLDDFYKNLETKEAKTAEIEKHNAEVLKTTPTTPGTYL